MMNSSIKFSLMKEVIKDGPDSRSTSLKSRRPISLISAFKSTLLSFELLISIIEISCSHSKFLKLFLSLQKIIFFPSIEKKLESNSAAEDEIKPFTG